MRHLCITAAALALALVAGCTRNDEARVRQGARDAAQRAESAAEGLQQTARSAALEAKIKAALATRKGLDGAEIDVEASDTVVTLKGDVLTREQADVAERVALDTEGVTAVNNQLMLRIPAKPTTAPPPG